MRLIAISLRRRRALALGIILGALLARAETAHAEVSASDRATARALAGEGYTALKSKDYATAEDRFRRADELLHAPTLVVDHARALIGLGRVGEAYAAYDSVIREELPPNAPAVWARAVKEARAEIETVKPQIAWLVLHVKGATEPQVEIDGRALSPQSLGVRLPETPGKLHIAARAHGFIAQTVDKRLNEGDEVELELVLQPIPEPAPVVVVVPAPPPRPADAPKARPKAGHTLAYVSFGVSGLGFAVGAATGILWLKARSDVKSACGGLACQPQDSTEQARQDDDKHRYDTYGTLSGIGFGVGLVAAATGVISLLSQPKESTESAAQQARIRPYVGPGWVGIYGAFQ